MALGDITREAVLAAIAEYDQLGQEEFLYRYGFDRARQYVLVHDGKRYDSKAIVGVAHGFLPGQTPLAASEFNGGKATVARLLHHLGFTVQVGDSNDLLAEIRPSERLGNSPAETAFAALALQQQRSLAAEYRMLCGRADIYWRGRHDKRTGRTSSVPVRYGEARLAVMLRSQGRCENPRCAGDIHELTDVGDPILEIDHIHDLAKGGEDNPAQMIALCPNCHAIKSRGSTRHDLKMVLISEAQRRHDELSES